MSDSAEQDSRKARPEGLTLIASAMPEPAQKRNREPDVFFDRAELDAILSVYGRKVGEAANYKYSDAHLASGLVWNDENLDKYITDPKGTIPGNKMVFAGIKDAEERKNLIAYLATLK